MSSTLLVLLEVMLWEQSVPILYGIYSSADYILKKILLYNKRFKWSHKIRNTSRVIKNGKTLNLIQAL